MAQLVDAAALNPVFLRFDPGSGHHLFCLCSSGAIGRRAVFKSQFSAGSRPALSTTFINLALVMELADMSALDAEFFGFESRLGHHIFRP